MKHMISAATLLLLISSNNVFSQYDPGYDIWVVGKEMWERIEELIERTDSQLRKELEQAFSLGNTNCDFYDRWFDTWSRIADQEALIDLRTKNLYEEILVMKVEVRNAAYKQQIDDLLKKMDDTRKDLRESIGYADTTRNMITDRRTRRCGNQ